MIADRYRAPGPVITFSRDMAGRTGEVAPVQRSGDHIEIGRRFGMIVTL